MKKLIRDKIPELIEDKSRLSRESDSKRLREYMAAKVLEEAQEVSEALLHGSEKELTEEIGDLYEILDRVIQESRTSLFTIQSQRKLKCLRFGGFGHNWILEVEDE
jgi:predicted house-cleaning noncanonical NTP pyrophosphatase (MazG superfamily)